MLCKKAYNIAMVTINNGIDIAHIEEFGARVTQLILNGVSIVRRDEGDNAKRSGIPILGPLVDANTGIWEKVAPTMPQHGTDRITEWKIVEKSDLSVTFRREYEGKDHPLIGEATLVFAFQDLYTFSITRTTKNTSNNAVAVGTGLHTYFPPTATFKDIDVFPLENGKSYHLDGMSEIRMQIEGKAFMIEAHPTPIETVVWAENAEDHICVEPWWAKVGSAPIMQPGETRTETYTIRCIV
jgi:galactose mutarotase-like enzyme